MRYSSRKCGLRRGFEQPRGGIAADQRNDAWARYTRPRSDRSLRNQDESIRRNAVRSTTESCERFAGSIPWQSVSYRESVCQPPPPAGHGLRSASAVAARKSPLWRLAPRRAPGTQIRPNLSALRNLAASNAVKPNPSLKRSANGRPPGPVWRYAVHFRQSGPGVLPSSPA